MNNKLSQDSNRIYNNELRTSDIYPEDKQDSYKLIHAQLKSLLENETYVISNLGNASALLKLAIPDTNWVGFYLIQNNELLLGPFQGKPACIHIPIGKGVCGTAVSERKTQVVPDVHAFPGHIACDSESKSEIVIPIIVEDNIIGVLDIDSPVFNRFDEIDKEGLEEVVRILISGCDWTDY
ncbi:MAG: GAF domain-containing protein [Anaerolineaceae bacterium]|nr:MAG: GAF domain-containing protein [Anaerolineaceae bacterium]